VSEELSPVEGPCEYVVIITSDLLETFQTLTSYRASAEGGVGYEGQLRLFMFYPRAYPAEILNRRFNAKQCLTGQLI